MKPFIHSRKHGLTLLAIMLFIHFQLFAQWVQKGADINGAASWQSSGRSVSMNGDGSTLVIGSPGEGTVTAYQGSGRVFQWDGTNWQQKGAAVYGENPQDQLGNSVSINEAGSIIALGSHYNDANGMNAGHVRVYEWDGTAWIKLGADIDGLEAEDMSNIVSLNASGNIVAIGAPQSLIEDDSGYVRVFEWISGSWIQKGISIYGEAVDDLSGVSVSLNNDGNVLAIGAPANDGNGFVSGQVRIYEWIGSTWIQKGHDIDGEHSSDGSGGSVSISGDGNTVAIGASGNSDGALYAGQARVFVFDGSEWVQKGADMDGQNPYDMLGHSISLSDGGDTVAVGAAEDWGFPIGFVKIYSWDGSSWIQVGSNIVANAYGVAESISLNNRGNIVAVGAYAHSGGGQGSGQVTVWEDITVGISEMENSNLFRVYPNPSYNEITIDLGQIFESITVTITNSIGQILRVETFYDVEKIQHDFKLLPGYYFAEISTDQEYIAAARFLKM